MIFGTFRVSKRKQSRVNGVAYLMLYIYIYIRLINAKRLTDRNPAQAYIIQNS